MLLSSNVAETDYAPWSAASTYALGARVLYEPAHHCYECLAEGTLGGAVPSANPSLWLDLGPTNRWAMFDKQVGTTTTSDAGTNSITVVLAAGRINSLALLEVDAELVTVQLVANGEIVYSATADMNTGTNVGDWYQYFYEPIYLQNTLVITNLLDATLLAIPAYGEGVLTVTLSRPLAAVSCGVMVVGLVAELGSTLLAPTVGITDYSIKTLDAFGNVTLTQRRFSKRMTAKVMVRSSAVDNVTRLMNQYRATPLVWLGSDGVYANMVLYGYYKDYTMTITNNATSTLDTQIEGLT